MKPAPAAHLRRLAPLTVLVLAAHLVVLEAGPPSLVPGPGQPLHFTARAVQAPSPVAPVRTAAIPPPAAPPPAAAAATAPRPPARRGPTERRAPVAAPAEAAAAAAPAQSQSQSPTAPPPTATTATPLALLPSARLRYEVTVQARGLTLGGQASLDWRHDGTQYEAVLEVKSLGLPSRVQRSVGRITAEGLAPDYFSDKARSEQATHFEREKGRLVFSNNRPGAALADGMQDRLSVVLQLAAMARGDPARFTPGTQLAIPTASTREAETWVFEVLGEEDLQLPGGALVALRLQRLPRRDYDQKVELWLAPRLDYAPVRVRLTNPNGDVVDQRWSSTDRG